MIRKNVISETCSKKTQSECLIYVESERVYGTTDLKWQAFLAGGKKSIYSAITMLIENIAQKNGESFEDLLDELEFVHKVSPELYMTGKKKGA